MALVAWRAAGGDDETRSAGLSLAAIQEAVDGGGGYVLEVRTRNLVLPQWGGTDDGTVAVTADGDAAEARLHRTGDGDYTIVAYNSETFFQRSTCPSFTRISGGGRDVLSPFLWKRTAAFRNGTLVRTEAVDADTAAVVARLEGLGEVRIEVDRQSRLPVRITRDASAAGRRWRSLPATGVPTQR